MAIADKLTKLSIDITNAYNEVENKGGTIPANKNTDNLASAIGSISTGTTPTGTKQVSISQNGTYTEDVTDYASAEISVNVPQPSGTKQISITANGTITEDVTNYANAEITTNISREYKHLISYTLASDAQKFTIPATEEAKKCTDFIIRVTGSLSAADWIYFSLNNASKSTYYNSKITSFDIVVGCAILEGFTFSDEKSLSRRYQFYNTFPSGNQSGATINSLNSFGFCTYTTTITIVAGTQIEIYGM